MAMFTDINRLRGTEPGNVEGNPDFTYLDAFSTDTEAVDHMKELYRAGGADENGKPILGDVAVKRRLAQELNAFLAPIREKRAEVEHDPDYVWDVLREGTLRGRERAASVMASVRQTMKIDYL
jgi:tryptophanyl-tRNA synthetase